MAVIATSPPRPDLRAHREAASLPFPELVQRLSEILGKKLTAYIGSMSDVRAVDRWIAGAGAYKSAEPRLRLAYHVALMLNEHTGKRVVQSWLTGLNPELQDRAPLRLLREGELEEIGPQVLTAARAFLAGG